MNTTNPLNQLLALAQQREDAERGIRAQVAAARAEGHSWQAIANALGGTKQAAQQRYTGPKAAAQLLADQVAQHQAEDRAKLTEYAARRDQAAARELHDHHTAAVTFMAAEQLPAETSTNLADKAPAKAKKDNIMTGWRPQYSIRDSPWSWQIEIPAVAQPGIGGKAPHACPNCDSTNHKGADFNIVEMFGHCTPTKYDPPYIAKFMKLVSAKEIEETKAGTLRK